MKGIRKILAFALAIACCFACFACKPNPDDFTQGVGSSLVDKKGKITYTENFPDDFNKGFLVANVDDFHYDETDGGKRAIYLYEKLRNIYYRDGVDFPWRLGYYESAASNSFVWDYGALFTMINAVCKANPDSDYAKEQLRDVADTLEKYYMRFESSTMIDNSLAEKGIEGNMLSDDFIDLATELMQISGEELGGDMIYRIPVRVYSSSPSGGDPYYDDNVWLVMALLDAGKTLGEKTYITRAEDCLMYVLSGWTIDAGGGLLWKENHPTKNTCSNGPAAMACMDFYNYYNSLTPATEEDRVLYEKKKTFYLQFAKYIYEWTKNILMDTTDGVYKDHINLSGDGSFTVDGTKSV